MSIQAISSAIALRGVTATEKLLMIALANYADADSRCYPSHRVLADDTCLTERTILSALKSLEAQGFVSRFERRRQDGSRASDLIKLDFERGFQQPADISPPEEIDVPSKPQLTVIGGETVSPPTTFEPRINRQKKNQESNPVGLDASQAENDLFGAARPARPLRGSRLASDWTPSVADRSFAEDNGLSPLKTERTAASFRDYWLAKPGQGGVKLDWSATWRNWVRSDVERNGGGAGAQRVGFV